MSIVPLVLFSALAAASAATDDPKALVSQLGSADEAARAEAARALEALGRAALPALGEAARGEDREIHARASSIWETIQRGLVTRPSLVRLNDRNRIMEEVLSELQAQTGMTLRLNQQVPDDRVAAHAPEPIPFWSALERLGLNSVFYHRETRTGFPILQLGIAPAPAFASIDGPFRCVLTGLHLHRDHRLIRGPWVRIDRFGQRINITPKEPDTEVTVFFGSLDIMVEPRVWFTQEGPARLTEATDDLGQSLVPDPADGDTQLGHGADFAFFAGSGVTNSQTEFLLRVTDRPGHSARLRGVVPLMLHVRRPEPMLVIPLADAADKTFRCDDAEFKIDSVNDAARDTSVRMTVKVNVDRVDLPENATPALIMTRLRVMGEHQLELVNADGKVVADTTAGGSGGGATPAVYHWTISAFQKGRATHLRYYSMLRTRADATFDFRNVPLP